MNKTTPYPISDDFQTNVGQQFDELRVQFLVSVPRPSSQLYGGFDIIEHVDLSGGVL